MSKDNFFIRRNTSELIEYLKGIGYFDNRSKMNEPFLVCTEYMYFFDISEHHIGVTHNLYVDYGTDEDKFRNTALIYSKTK